MMTSIRDEPCLESEPEASKGLDEGMRDRIDRRHLESDPGHYKILERFTAQSAITLGELEHLMVQGPA